jgi:hypothetical protein
VRPIGSEDFRYLFSDLHGPRAAATRVLRVCCACAARVLRVCTVLCAEDEYCNSDLRMYLRISVYPRATQNPEGAGPSVHENLNMYARGSTLVIRSF